jgi:hypothetical protein
MRKNLLKEMIDKNITFKDLAEVIEVTERTVKDKTSGKYDFSLKEVLKIRKDCFPKKDIEYLFKDFEETG